MGVRTPWSAIIPSWRPVEACGPVNCIPGSLYAIAHAVCYIRRESGGHAQPTQDEQAIRESKSFCKVIVPEMSAKSGDRMTVDWQAAAMGLYVGIVGSGWWLEGEIGKCWKGGLFGNHKFEVKGSMRSVQSVSYKL